MRPEASERTTILVRADASHRIGGGHIMRCLSLADELAGRSASVTFVCASIPATLATRVKDAGHRLLLIEPVTELLAETAQWDSSLLSSAAQAIDAERTLAAAGAAQWIILDHYRLDTAWLEAAGPSRKLVLDDLANRPLACDFIVDQTFGRSADDYRDLVPPHCTVLAGARYAMLRPEFAAGRQAALARRQLATEVPRVLVAMGSTDFGGLTAQVVNALLARDITNPIDVVFGDPSSPEISAVQALVEAHPGLNVHIETREMAALMAQADVAVGTAGVSSWERCCLGLPTVVLVVADNQNVAAHHLAEVEAIVIAANPLDAGTAVAGLLADEARRLAMVAAAAAIVDGKGAGRIADAIGGTAALPLDRPDSSAVTLRSATQGDALSLWLWRNDPLTRSVSQNTAPVAWPEHVSWLTRSFALVGRDLFVAEAGGRAIGMVRFDLLDEHDLAFEISINIAPEHRGGGTGSAVLAAGCEMLLRTAGPARLEATIEAGNAASIRLFERLGFNCAGRLSETEFLRYVRLNDSPSQSAPS